MSRVKDLDSLAPDESLSARPSLAGKGAPPKKSPSKPLHSTNFRQEVYRLVGRSHNPFSAFLARPRSFAFNAQYEGEEIILVLRRHLITNLGWILVFIVMLFAPSVLNFFPLFDSFPARYQFIFILFWYLISFAFFLENFLSWYFNVYIITDERIVDVDFYSMIYKEISDAEIEAIQDVTVRQGGILPTLLNYGTVLIQTAAEKPRFGFEDVPNPNKVAKVLQQLRLEEKQEAIEGRIS